MNDSQKGKRPYDNFGYAFLSKCRQYSKKLDNWLDKSVNQRLNPLLDTMRDKALEKTSLWFNLSTLTQKTKLLLVGASLGALLLGFLAGFSFWYFSTSTKDIARKGPNGDAPLELLPYQSFPGEGVSVMAKQLPPETIVAKPVYAPVVQGAEKASGFAMDLGASQSFAELSKTFAEIADMNNSKLFNQLEPRAILNETPSQLEARLLVGPFETLKDALSACQSIKLPQKTVCSPVPFDGQLIARK